MLGLNINMVELGFNMVLYIWIDKYWFINLIRVGLKERGLKEVNI